MVIRPYGIDKREIGNYVWWFSPHYVLFGLLLEVIVV